MSMKGKIKFFRKFVLKVSSSSDTEAEAEEGVTKLEFKCGCYTLEEDLLTGELCPKHEEMNSSLFNEEHSSKWISNYEERSRNGDLEEWISFEKKFLKFRVFKILKNHDDPEQTDLELADYQDFEDRCRNAGNPSFENFSYLFNEPER